MDHPDAGFVDGFYFTVVSLTTVGYGDIVPYTPGAKIIVSGFTRMCSNKHGAAEARPDSTSPTSRYSVQPFDCDDVIRRAHVSRSRGLPHREGTDGLRRLPL